MKHIILTVLVCLEVAAFTAIYLRATEIMMRAIVEGLSRGISVYRMLSPARSHQTFIGCRRA